VQAARQTNEQPDRHHQRRAQQKIAPRPTHRIEPHVPDAADQGFQAAQNIQRIETDRGQDEPDEDRQQDKPQQNRKGRAAEEAADQAISRPVSWNGIALVNIAHSGALRLGMHAVREH